VIRICGLDEVGRGAFAGPLVAAAVVVRGRLSGLFEGSPVPIRDSKALSHSQRQRVVSYLTKKGIKTAIEVISAKEINERGMGWANKEIFIRLMAKMKASRYIVDGNLKFILGENKKVKSRIKADRSTPQVILASIIAKLHRDKIMRKLDKQYPRYLWRQNKGYGTAKHREVIQIYGACEQHRTKWLTTWLSKIGSSPISPPIPDRQVSPSV